MPEKPDAARRPLPAATAGLAAVRTTLHLFLVKEQVP
jgi:hypothetical protein